MIRTKKGAPVARKQNNIALRADPEVRASLEREISYRECRFFASHENPWHILNYFSRSSCYHHLVWDIKYCDKELVLDLDK